MKRTPILLLPRFAALTLTLSDLADARRMGGGRSLGRAARKRHAVKPAPAPTAPAGNAATQTPSTPAAGAAKAAPGPTPAPSGASRWLGPIAGLAAGLGLCRVDVASRIVGRIRQPAADRAGCDRRDLPGADVPESPANGRSPAIRRSKPELRERQAARDL